MSAPGRRVFLNVILVVLTLLYPLGVYFGLEYLDPRYFILILAVLFLFRIFFIDAPIFEKKQNGSLILLILFVVFFIFVFVNNSLLGLLFYPVLINAGMFVLFFYTLMNPPSMIEHFARIREPEMPEGGIAYTRKVTMIWCVFFVFNGSIAAWTALFGSMKTWSLYNGFISYVLIGILFAVEYIVRCQVRKKLQ